MGDEFSNVRKDKRRKYGEMTGKNVQKEAKKAQKAQSLKIQEQEVRTQRDLAESTSELSNRKLRMSRANQGRSGLLGG